MSIKEAYEELQEVLKRELGLVPTVQIYFHSAYNRGLSFTPYARWAAEVMAEALGETVEADSSGCCNWFRVGDAVTVFYDDDMDYTEYREAGMLA
jgi:hypothetical protein